MKALRLHRPGLEGLSVDDIDPPTLQTGEVLVRVRAAALTRDELDWFTDRFPRIPSFEVSGVVEDIAEGVDGFSPGDEVVGMTAFDRDGVATELTAVPAELLATKPPELGHVEAAALPLAALSAWQGLFDHGRLEPGGRVVVHGASGGVGHLATQLARARGAHVVATVSSANGTVSGADVVVDRSRNSFEEALDGADLVFDTVGGDVLVRSVAAGARVVSVAEEAPGAAYFVVEPNAEELAEIMGLAAAGVLVPVIDSVFPLAEGREAFARLASSGKRGKVVLDVGR